MTSKPSTRAPRKTASRASRSRTATSTRQPSEAPRLSTYARKFVYPSGIVKTVWPRVEAKGQELGLGFDWWQSQLGTVCLGYGTDGKYVATVGGVGLSIPRQVGKTYFVLALLVIMCILFPGLQVVWTAHHLRTSTKTFTALRGICRRKKVAPYIKPGGIRSANGEQQVEFANGSLIMFGARSMGFGRGFDEIDVEVYDEAQILDTKSLEDMIAATNQARHEHGALLFFMGTPPRPTDPSDAFTERRTEAWKGETDDAVWLEIGADPKSSPDDRSQWPLMNPSFPKRTPVESMLRLRKNLKNEDSWNREGRGIWDEDAAPGLITVGEWADLALPNAKLPEKLEFAVDVSPDRLNASIGAAGPSGDRTLLFVVESDVGTRWIVPTLVKLKAEKGLTSVTIDTASPAASLIPRIEKAGITVREANAATMGRACAELLDGVRSGEVAHLGDPILTDALRSADVRDIGDGGWGWKRKGSANITPLVAVTLALSACHEAASPTPFALWG